MRDLNISQAIFFLLKENPIPFLVRFLQVCYTRIF